MTLRNQLARRVGNRMAGQALTRLSPLAPVLRAAGGTTGLRRAGTAVRAASTEAGGTVALAREVLVGMPALAGAVVALARDRSIPNRYRIGLAALVPYLLSPVDAIPVVGQLSDAAVVLLVLGWVARGVGEDRLLDQWQPSPILRSLFHEITRGAKRSRGRRA